MPSEVRILLSPQTSESEYVIFSYGTLFYDLRGVPEQTGQVDQMKIRFIENKLK